MFRVKNEQTRLESIKALFYIPVADPIHGWIPVILGINIKELLSLAHPPKCCSHIEEGFECLSRVICTGCTVSIVINMLL